MTDTTDEAVERLAADYSGCGLRDDDLVAATLRALLAERAALRQERDGWHWLQNARGCPEVAFWTGHAWGNYDHAPQPNPVTYRYLGPCLTPAEVDARVAAAWDARNAILARPAPEGADALAAALAQARREGIEAAAAWHDAEAAACDGHIAQMPDADPGGGCLSLVSQLRERARLHRADAISIRALLPAPPDVAQTSGKKSPPG